MTEIEKMAREMEQMAFEGRREEFLAAAMQANTRIRETQVLSDEERLAIGDVTAASLANDVAARVLGAVDALLAIQQPMNAAALLRAVSHEPMLTRVTALHTRLKQIDHALRVANSFAEFAKQYDIPVGQDPPTVLHEPRNAFALDEARRILRSLPEHYTTHEVLAVGPYHGHFEDRLLEEFPKVKVTCVELAQFQPVYERLSAKYPDRVRYFKPTGYYDLPKQDGGYDLVVALEVIEHQPNPRAYIACLQEQCSRGIYSVPEALKWYVRKDTVEAETYQHLHGFCEESLRKVFEDLGFSVKTTRLPSGHVVAVSEPE